MSRDRDATIAVKAALADPRQVCGRLGLLDRALNTGRRDVRIPCPAHNGTDPNCAVNVARDRTIWCHCHTCDWRGDVLDLIAVVERLDIRADFVRVLDRAAVLAGVNVAAPPPHRELPPLPLREPPPIEEVRRVLSGGAAPRDDREASTWLRSRGLDAARCRRLARALRDAWPRWARYQRTSWQGTGHRLLLPVYDALGTLRSLRARAVRADVEPKSLPPGGCASAGLLLASPCAVELLRAGPTSSPARIVIVEGEPDYLTWASRLPPPWSVIGLPGSGAWTRTAADRIPDGSTVVVRTDRDDAGDRYASIVQGSLGDRCHVLITDRDGRARRAAKREAERAAGRPPKSGERHDGDDNDMLQRGRLPADPREGTAQP